MAKKTEERLNELRCMLELFKKTNRQIDKTFIAKQLGLSRGALYKKDSKYREVLAEYGAFDKKQRRDIAPKELLIERIKQKDIEIKKLHNKIEKLSKKYANLEYDYDMLLKKHAHEERHVMRIQGFYEKLISQYSIMTGDNVEPFDLHNFTSPSENIYKYSRKSNIVPLLPTEQDDKID